MTIASTTNRVTTVGNGSTTAYPVSFPFHAQADLIVVSTVILTGAQTTKTITTHYTISGTPDALGHYSNGGTVNFLVAPASTERITIYRDPSRVQSLDLVENNSLPAESLEASIDYQTMLIQRVADLIGRSLRQPDGDSANIGPIPSTVSRASLVLGFDAGGEPIAVAVTGAVGTALPITGGTITGDLTVTTSSVPKLRMNTTNATDKRGQVQFMKNGTTLWTIGTDFQSANGTNSLTLHDAEAALDRLVISSAGVVTANGGTLSINATQSEVAAGTSVKAITADLNKITTLTAQAASVPNDFTIPAGALQIEIIFLVFSLSGTDDILVQVGDAGGLENTGYVSTSAAIAAAGTTVASSTAGFIIKSGVAANVFSGTMRLTKYNSSGNTWVAGHSLKSSATVVAMGGGECSAMASALTTVRVTRTGTDTFDAGTIAVNYIR